MEVTLKLAMASSNIEGPAEGVLEDPRIRELYLGKAAGAGEAK